MGAAIEESGQTGTPAVRAAISDLQAGYFSGTVAMNEVLAGLTLDDGLALQLRVLDSHIAAGEALGGWKVGMTSGGSLDRMGKGFRPFGYILKRRIHQSGETVALLPAGPAEIEPELCFRVELPLSGPVSPETVRASVSGAIPAFELLASRIQGQAPQGATIADDLTQWGLVLGTQSVWKGEVADMAVALEHNGQPVVSAGPGFAIDSPFESIAALCKQLHRFGRGLNRGEHIITGAFHRAPFRPGLWSARFADVGAVTVSAG